MDILSAAFYFHPVAALRLSEGWLDRVVAFVESKGVSFELANVAGTHFSTEKMYDFSDIREQLAAGTSAGDVASLSLYSMLPHFKQYEFGWKCMLSLDVLSGLLYLGFEHTLMSNEEELVRTLFDLSADDLSVCYGYSFVRAMHQGPYLYSIGFIAGLSYDDKDQGEADQITAWNDEMMGDQRYLASYFRGAFSANVLSVHHVNSAQLLGANRVGTLSKLNDSSYLWRLNDAERQLAESNLKDAGVLI